MTTTGAPSGSSTVDALAPVVPPAIVNPYSTVAVRTHVPVLLDLKIPNYHKWSSFFKTMCGKFGLLSHIDGSAPATPADPLWIQANYSVLSWLYGSITDNILDVTMEPDQTACHLWVAIETLFCDNKESRAIFLSNQFHSLVQGDLSVSEYTQRLKTLADSLRDVGHTVSDSQLVLNMLRGLNPRFSNTADDIANATPFPSFSKARSIYGCNASATESQEASSHARATRSGQSSTCHFGKHRHSPSRSAEKKCLVCLTRIYYKNEPDFYKRTTRAFPQVGLDQNFVDEEAKEKGESRRCCSKKRLKSADSMMDDQVVPSVKAELQQVGCLNAREKDTDDRDGSLEVDVGLLDAEPGSSSCKGHGPKE